MLSTLECKKLLEKNGNKYTKEEAESIKDFLKIILDIQLDQLLKTEKNETCGNNVKSVLR